MYECFNSTANHRNLHSFPTRRSSDLRVEFIERDMHRRIAAAPTPPGAPRLEDAQRPGQVIGLVPMIEARLAVLEDRKSTRLNSSHANLVCRLLLEKKKNTCCLNKRRV